MERALSGWSGVRAGGCSSSSSLSLEQGGQDSQRLGIQGKGTAGCIYTERSMPAATVPTWTTVRYPIFTPLKADPEREAKFLLSPLFRLIVCHTKGLLSSHDTWTEPSCTGPEK